MLKVASGYIVAMLLTSGFLGQACRSASASVRIEGQVQAGGGSVASSAVTLWAATESAPRRLAETKSASDGRFEVGTDETPDKDAVLYLVAKGGVATINKDKGDNPAIVLLAMLGDRPPANVTVNEFTSVASVWTATQFLNGDALSGPALGLRIAAGNVPNFVDLQTGGWGSTIQNSLNSGQTPTMANFATLADVLAGAPPE
jgi:hypothetical protein